MSTRPALQRLSSEKAELNGTRLPSHGCRRRGRVLISQIWGHWGRVLVEPYFAQTILGKDRIPWRQAVQPQFGALGARAMLRVLHHERPSSDAVLNDTRKSTDAVLSDTHTHRPLQRWHTYNASLSLSFMLSI
eukprot:scaffold105213_cov22-Tisochrysis_lutea.AAC.1